MQLDIKITNRCDLRCSMCAQWGESGYNLEKSSAELKAGECDAEDYVRLVEEISAWKPLIYIWGGEPLLYPDIRAVVEALKERGMTVSMVTNGTTLASHAEWIVEAGLDLLMVSLDGPDEVHDRVRGLPGAHRRLLEGMAAVREARAASVESGPYIVPLITINRDNTHVLHETFSICEEQEADFVGIYYSWFNNEEVGSAHAERFQRHFGETPTAWQGYCGGAKEVDVDSLLESRKAIKQRKWSFPFIFIPNLPGEEAIREYYEKPDTLFGFQDCLAPYFMVLILPNGDVATCRDYPDYVVGNIKEQSLSEIFNNGRYRRFRQALKEEGLFPICARCCGLMGY
jgi:radical SAM protein with 4Fe4S-binding SPASM domain